MELPIYDSIEEYTADKAQLEKNLKAVQPRKFATLSPVFIRSGNTTKVNVYYSYDGSDIANALKIKNMEIWNASLLHRELLATLNPGFTEFTAGKSARVPLGNVTIPKSETSVRVNVDSIQVYILNTGWVSGTDPMGQWDIS